MATIRDNAVSIRRWDFSETSQTASLFAREHGIIRGLAKGAKRQRGRFSGGIDPLTRGQLVAIIKPNRDLATITEWHLEEVYWPVRKSLPANRAGLYMADMIHHMMTAQDPHPLLFDQLARSLDEMAAADAIEPALLRFQWSLLKEAGYQPELDTDAETGRPLPAEPRTLAFSARAGGAVEDNGDPDRWRVRAETIGLLRQLASGSDGQGAPAAVVARANRLLAAYCRELLGLEVPTLAWAFPDLGPSLVQTGAASPTEDRTSQEQGR